MIKHIVMWKLKDEYEGKSKHDNAMQLKLSLEALNGRITGLINLEVGLQIKDSHSDGLDYDVVLYSEFESMQTLEEYYVHPEHLKLVPFAKAIRTERALINYEV